jgi:hypothetical protein
MSVFSSGQNYVRPCAHFNRWTISNCEVMLVWGVRVVLQLPQTEPVYIVRALIGRIGTD